MGTAESDVDRGFIVDDDDEFAAGVISLTLLHEFAGEGFAEVACEDGGDDEVVDNGDASWSNLRITAIKLGSFQNGLLLQ